MMLALWQMAYNVRQIFQIHIMGLKNFFLLPVLLFAAACGRRENALREARVYGAS